MPSSNLIERLRTWSSQQIFIVFAAFLVYILADGTTFSFGLFVDELITQYSNSISRAVLQISTIAALTQSVPLLLSPLVCWATTRYGASRASLIGCLLSASGYFFPFIFYFKKTLWIPAVGYGCLLSVGLAFCYVPAYLTLPYYFEDDLGFATGLAVSGSGVGQVALAIIVKACVIEYGWRGASLITGGLFLFMLVSVLAFRRPFSPLPASKLAEVTKDPSMIVTCIDEKQDENDDIESSIEPSRPQRSRGMTFAQILPLLISSVPVHAGATISSIESQTNSRRNSLNLRRRTQTVITGHQSHPEDTTIIATKFSRARANTIDVSLPTIRPKSGKTFEPSPPSWRRPPLEQIVSIDESEDNNNKRQSSEEPIETIIEPIIIPAEPTPTTHWLTNSRFLLFCFSNFLLCLVMGVPYVIIPTYISETFTSDGYLVSWTLSNVGIASALGQILLGYLHSRQIFTAWLMYTLAVIMSGIALIVLGLFHYKFVVLICAFLYGLAVSANYALQVIIIIDAVSMNNMANAFGLLQFCQGVSTLIGIPLQGLLRDLSHTYRLSFLTSGFIIIISGMIMFFWPCLKSASTRKM